MQCARASIVSWIVLLQALLNASLWPASSTSIHGLVQDTSTIKDPGHSQGSRKHGGVDTSSFHIPNRALHSEPQYKSQYESMLKPNQASSKHKAARRLLSPPPQTGPFLIPLLPYGLSNQVLALKEALALAVVLNYTVVTLGFWPHRSDFVAAAGQPLEHGELTHRAVLELDSEEGREENEEGAGKQTQRRHMDASEVIPFDLVFDRSSLAPLVRIITWEEAVRQYGWPRSKRADMVIALSRSSGLESVLEKAAAAGLMYSKHIRVVRNYSLSCDSEGLSWLARTAGRKRWVALYSYRRVVPAARSSYHSFAQDSDPCTRAYHEVSLRLTKSALIAKTATNFVQEALTGWALRQQRHQQQGEKQEGETAVAGSAGVGAGGGVTPHYIAVHVRPYPDECLEYYVNMTQYDADAAKQVCKNPKLLIKVVSLVRMLVEARATAAAAAETIGSVEQKAGGGGTIESSPPAVPTPVPVPAAVFVMSHPRLRGVIEAEVSRLWVSEDYNLTAIFNATDDPVIAAAVTTFSSSSPPPPLPYLFFLGLSDLPPELRNHAASISLLSMVEQQVCRQAEDFIGTKASSISVMVAQERVLAVLGAERVGPGGAVAVDGGGMQEGEEMSAGGPSRNGYEGEVDEAASAVSVSGGSGGGYGFAMHRMTVLV